MQAISEPLQFNDQVRGWLQPALDFGKTHAIEDIEAQVHTGHMQLWVGDKGAAVTQILNYPRRRLLHVFLVGGDMEQVLDFVPSFKKWAEMQGCEKVTMSGRKGWSRVLPKVGGAVTGITMEIS